MTGIFYKKLVRYGAGFLLPLIILLGNALPVAGQSAGPNRAGLVVMHGDRSVITRCVSFEESEITGLTLLQRSGLLWQSSNGPMGAALCAVDGEGCPASDCFCQCKQAPCAYWNYFTGNGDGSWAYSGTGAAVRTLSNGDVDGWVWGDGSKGPQPLTFEAICSGGNTGAPVVTPSAPTASPTPQAVATSTPSATATPTESVTPTATPPPTATPTPAPESAASRRPTSSPTDTPTARPPTATATLTTAPLPTAAAIMVTPVPEEPVNASKASTSGAQLGVFALIAGVLVIIFLTQRRRLS